MATHELNSRLDIGPTTCSIFTAFNSGTASVENLLKFAEYDNGCVAQLDTLLAEYSTYIQSKPVHLELVLFYVAQWIHFTNKIEFAGFEEEIETRQVVMKGQSQSNSTPEKEVLQMLELLWKTYSAELSSVDRVATQFKSLKNWHSTMFADIMNDPGQFRQCGAYSEAEDGLSAHIYPHHSILEKATEKWMQLCYLFAKEISTYTLRSAKIRYLFALAAFAQFHIADIHPFPDGNGRVCRFVSKFILDEILPLPIPMFQDRSKYISSLVQGRLLPAEESPLLLFQLLLETAVDTYQPILEKYKSYRTILASFICSNEDELEAELSKRSDVEDHLKQEIKDKFNCLEVGQSETVVYKMDIGVFKVMRVAQPEEEEDDTTTIDEL